MITVANFDDSFLDCGPDSIRNTGRGLVSCYASLDSLHNSVWCRPSTFAYAMRVVVHTYR